MPCPVHQNLTGQSMQRWLLLCLLITLLDSFHLLEERKSPRFFPLVLDKHLIKHLGFVSDGLDEQLVIDGMIALRVYELAALAVGAKAFLAELAALLGFISVGKEVFIAKLILSMCK